MRTHVVALARTRVAQFLVLGAGIFAITRRPPENRIHIDAGALAALRAEQARRLGVSALSPDEEDALVSRVVEDALLAREARRLGLDDDEIVKKRLVQKVLFLAEDLGGASRWPTDSDLQGFFAENRGRYVRPPHLRFAHVFASTREAASRLKPSVEAFAATGPLDNEAPPLGEPFLGPRSLFSPEEDVLAFYGPELLASLRAAPLGVWTGPVASKLGWHLVRVVAREPGRPATFEEVRSALPLDAMIAKREAAVARYVEAAFARYRVDVGGVPFALHRPTRRTAVHAPRSGED